MEPRTIGPAVEHPGVVKSTRRLVAPASEFAGFCFPPEVITLAVRWYLRFGLSYRAVEELLALPPTPPPATQQRPAGWGGGGAVRVGWGFGGWDERGRTVPAVRVGPAARGVPGGSGKAGGPAASSRRCASRRRPARESRPPSSRPGRGGPGQARPTRPGVQAGLISWSDRAPPRRTYVYSNRWRCSPSLMRQAVHACGLQLLPVGRLAEGWTPARPHTGMPVRPDLAAWAARRRPLPMPQSGPPGPVETAALCSFAAPRPFSPRCGMRYAAVCAANPNWPINLIWPHRDGADSLGCRNRPVDLMGRDGSGSRQRMWVRASFGWTCRWYGTRSAPSRRRRARRRRGRVFRLAEQ